MTNKKVGRPTVITNQVVSLLITAFHSGLSVREACWQSGISHEAYYSKLRGDQEFADKMAKAQSRVTVNAKELVAKAIAKGDLAIAKWWLERKEKVDTFDNVVVAEPQQPPISLDRAIEILDDKRKMDDLETSVRKLAKERQRLFPLPEE